jgi:hypothetical protein
MCRPCSSRVRADRAALFAVIKLNVFFFLIFLLLWLSMYRFIMIYSTYSHWKHHKMGFGEGKCCELSKIRKQILTVLTFCFSFSPMWSRRHQNEAEECKIGNGLCWFWCLNKYLLFFSLYKITFKIGYFCAKWFLNSLIFTNIIL